MRVFSIYSMIPLLLLPCTGGFFLPPAAESALGARNGFPYFIHKKSDGTPVTLYVYMPPYIQEFVKEVLHHVDLVVHLKNATPPWKNLFQVEDQRSHEYFAYFRYINYPHLAPTIEEADIVFFPWFRLSGLLLRWLHFNGEDPRFVNLLHLDAMIYSDALLERHIEKTLIFCDGWKCEPHFVRIPFFSRAIVAKSGGPWPKCTSCVEIPAPVNTMLFEVVSREDILNDDRNTTFFFRGSVRKFTGAWLRPKLAALDWKALNGIYDLQSKTITRSSSLAKEAFYSYLGDLLHSKYCLVVAGKEIGVRPMY